MKIENGVSNDIGKLKMKNNHLLTHNSKKEGVRWLFGLFLCFLLCAASVAASAQSGTTGDLEWIITDGTLTISGTGAMPDYTTITISKTSYLITSPWYSYRYSITALVINDGVTSIGRYAFMNCSYLTKVTFLNSVKSIGNQAFYSCSSLTEVTIPNSVISLGDDAFGYCNNLTKITIPNSVTSIGERTFSRCSNLTGITIPNSVETIGNFAFYGCNGLRSIIIPNSVTSIGDRTFSECGSLTSIDVQESNTVYTSENGVLFNKAKTVLFRYPEGKPDINYVIPNSVTSIGSSAFFGCINLRSVIIPNSVTSIRDNAFSGCSSLTEIIIPDLVETIGSSAFSGCSNLTKVIIPNSVTSIGNDAFYYCSNLTEVFIPNSVISIGNGVFTFCNRLTKVTIPNSVTSIGDYAFFDCRSLAEVTIPNSVTSIGNNAFYYCESLTEITIPNSVTSIGGDAFAYCYGLTEVVIPNSVTSIGDWAFFCCNNITEVTIPNSVISIGYQAFALCSSLAEVTIPNSVTSIGNGAFENCSGLTSLIIGNSVTSIGDAAFWFCSSLTSVAIPGSVETFGAYIPFLGCSSLVSIDVNENNTVFASEDGVLFNKSKTELISYPEGKPDLNYTIPNSVETIGNNAFRDCTSLTELIISYSVTSIRENSISGCSSLSSFNVEENNTVFFSEDGVLFNKSKTELIRYPEGKLDLHYFIPNSVTSIGNDAFLLCKNLTEVTIPNSVISIGHYAFEYCSSLTSVINLAMTPQDMGWSVFYSVNISQCVLRVHPDVINDYKAADVWKEFVILSVIPVDLSLNKSDLTLTVGDTEQLIATSYETVTWNSSNTAIATVDNNGTVTTVATGNTYITVTTQKDNQSAVCMVTVTSQQITGVETPAAPHVRIYPNPTDGLLTLQFETTGGYVVSVCDMTGKILLRQTTSDPIMQLDLNNYPAGVYLLTVEYGKQRITTRVVKN